MSKYDKYSLKELEDLITNPSLPPVAKETLEKVIKAKKAETKPPKAKAPAKKKVTPKKSVTKAVSSKDFVIATSTDYKKNVKVVLKGVLPKKKEGVKSVSVNSYRAEAVDLRSDEVKSGITHVSKSKAADEYIDLLKKYQDIDKKDIQEGAFTEWVKVNKIKTSKIDYKDYENAKSKQSSVLYKNALDKVENDMPHGFDNRTAIAFITTKGTTKGLYGTMYYDKDKAKIGKEISLNGTDKGEIVYIKKAATKVTPKKAAEPKKEKTSDTKIADCKKALKEADYTVTKVKTKEGKTKVVRKKRPERAIVITKSESIMKTVKKDIPKAKKEDQEFMKVVDGIASKLQEMLVKLDKLAKSGDEKKLNDIYELLKGI
jgi:hypothetical protein